MEMGDQCTIRCDANDLICELDFKTKVSIIKTKIVEIVKFIQNLCLPGILLRTI